MNDIRTLTIRYSIYTAMIIFILLITALINSDSAFFFGMAFGTSFSLLNMISTYFQVKRIGKTMVDRKYRFTFGTLGRLITVIFAIFIAQQFPQYLDLTGVILGLAVTYIILMIEPLFHIKKMQ